MDIVTLNTVISGISLSMVAIGVAISLYVASRGRSKDAEEDKASAATDTAKIFVSLDNLMHMMDEIKRTVNDTNRKMDDHTERIVILETSIKTLYERREEANRRLCELENKHNEVMSTCSIRKGYHNDKN